MDVKYSKFYQLGNGGDLISERDLDQLSELLEHPHPEFFGLSSMIKEEKICSG